MKDKMKKIDLDIRGMLGFRVLIGNDDAIHHHIQYKASLEVSTPVWDGPRMIRDVNDAIHEQWTLNDHDVRQKEGRGVSGSIWNGPVRLLRAIRTSIGSQMEKPHEER